MENEKLAHDLALVYLTNRFGIKVSGDGDGVSTKRLPDFNKVKMLKVGTGEKGLFGIEKKTAVEKGLKVDDTFISMISEYYKAYNRILMILNSYEWDELGNIDKSLIDVIWYCDGCGERLDNQEGFNLKSGKWICSDCGFENDVTEDNIF